MSSEEFYSKLAEGIIDNKLDEMETRAFPTPEN